MPAAGLYNLAWQILDTQYRVIRACHPDALRAQSPEPLHDMRVAFRRVRAAFRLFREPLADTPAAELDRAIRELNRALGEARDADVWLGFLEMPALVRAAGDDAGWQAYLDTQRGCLAAQHERVAATLQSDTYHRVTRQLAELLPAERPTPRADLTDPPRRFAARRLRKLYRRVRNQKKPRRRHAPEELHDTRRLCRRLRYWAEFCVPLFDPTLRELAVRAKAVADALGDYRDADLAIHRLCAEPAPPPPAVLRVLKKRRAKAWARGKVAWARLTRRKFRRRVQKRLALLTKGKT